MYSSNELKINMELSKAVDTVSSKIKKMERSVWGVELLRVLLVTMYLVWTLTNASKILKNLNTQQDRIVEYFIVWSVATLVAVLINYMLSKKEDSVKLSENLSMHKLLKALEQGGVVINLNSYNITYVDNSRVAGEVLSLDINFEKAYSIDIETPTLYVDKCLIVLPYSMKAR